jgi:hypothetical protein
MEVFTRTAPKHRWLQDLEEFLYVEWELTLASHHTSMWSLLNGSHLIFSYHRAEFVEVWLDPDGRIMMKDLPQGWGSGVKS